ncbi:CaiB/BaiF CoA transferase family protein [Brevibacillus sp. B_LB10_24]|uniref:CaiB/BaiF CoA transferase family protein n=1 Tax=Brevibacillus sp. B_LB10_24 TaxID=3380645 RepID=UPI0038BC5714
MLTLKGIRVLEWSEGIAGPLACQMLGDLGADVIKVERPAGDWGRGMGPGQKEGSMHFISLNRNKRNICLDVKKPGGLEVARSLVKSADVLICNYRPGAMERLGLGFDQVHACNPRMIYGRVSAYGYEGPLSELPGSDTVMQAISGIMNQVGDSEGVPYRVGVQVIDHTAARDLVIGVMAGLLSRMRGEELQHPIDVNLIATGAALQAQQWQEFFTTRAAPKRMGNRNAVLAPAGLYETKDGKYITIAVLREEHWVKFCRVLGQEHLLEDPAFASNALRLTNRERLEAVLVPLFQSRTQEEWVPFLTEQDILVAAVNDLEQIYRNKDLMNCIPVTRLPEGALTSGGDSSQNISIGLPVMYNGNLTPQARYGPPVIGEHTYEILQELHFDDQKIQQLVSAGTVFQRRVAI